MDWILTASAFALTLVLPPALRGPIAAMLRSMTRTAMPTRTVLATRLSLPKPNPFSTTSLLRQAQQNDEEASLSVDEAGASSLSLQDEIARPSIPLNEGIERPKPKKQSPTVSFLQELQGPSTSSSLSSSPSKSKGWDSEDVWASLMQTASTSTSTASKGLELNSADIQAIRGGSLPLYKYNATEPLSPADRFEDAWRRRYQLGPKTPRKPSDGRVVEVKSDVGIAYSKLMSMLAKNNVRKELRLEEHYEKPNQKRRRLKSERHRRRFAAAVREKVQLVSDLWYG